jgi:hypothetical protein
MLVIQQTEAIVAELQKRMDELCFRWKSSDSLSEYDEAKPFVYTFVFDDTTNDLPIKTPSILVQLTELDGDGKASYLAYVCVCHPAVMDKEITTPVKGKDGIYTYNDGKNIDSAGVRLELYKYCVMLGEQVYLALKRMNNSSYHITDVVLNTPSPFLDKFPYCECTVAFNTKVPDIRAFSINESEIRKYL